MTRKHFNFTDTLNVKRNWLLKISEEDFFFLFLKATYCKDSIIIQLSTFQKPHSILNNDIIKPAKKVINIKYKKWVFEDVNMNG